MWKEVQNIYKFILKLKNVVYDTWIGKDLQSLRVPRQVYLWVSETGEGW